METEVQQQIPAPARITILIAEDDPLLRQLLERLLALHDDFSVSGSVGDGRLVLDEIRATSPSLLLLDLTLPGMHGLTVLDRLIDFPDAPFVLVLSGHESDEIQMESARHGAHGFLGKSQGIETLPEAIRAIHGGQVWFTRSVMGRIFTEYVRLARRVREFDRPGSVLSPKENQVIQWLARGLTNQQIAGQLGMSVSTVKVHVRNILQKLDLPNRTEAAVYAVREGLLDERDGQDAMPAYHFHS